MDEKIAVFVKMMQNIVAKNAHIAQNQDEYQKRYDSLVQRYYAAKVGYDEVVKYELDHLHPYCHFDGSKPLIVSMKDWSR